MLFDAIAYKMVSTSRLEPPLPSGKILGLHVTAVGVFFASNDFASHLKNFIRRINALFTVQHLYSSTKVETCK